MAQCLSLIMPFYIHKTFDERVDFRLCSYQKKIKKEGRGGDGCVYGVAVMILWMLLISYVIRLYMLNTGQSYLKRLKKKRERENLVQVAEGLRNKVMGHIYKPHSVVVKSPLLLLIYY